MHHFMFTSIVNQDENTNHKMMMMMMRRRRIIVIIIVMIIMIMRMMNVETIAMIVRENQLSITFYRHYAIFHRGLIEL